MTRYSPRACLGVLGAGFDFPTLAPGTCGVRLRGLPRADARRGPGPPTDRSTNIWSLVDRPAPRVGRAFVPVLLRADDRAVDRSESAACPGAGRVVGNRPLPSMPHVLVRSRRVAGSRARAAVIRRPAASHARHTRGIQVDRGGARRGARGPGHEQPLAAAPAPPWCAAGT